MNKFWDKDTHTIGPFGENEILFTAEYWMFKKLLKEEINIDEMDAAIKSQELPDKSGFVSKDKNESWSHDNHSGLVCLSKLAGLDYHKKFFYKDMWRRMHPRDLIFYAYVSGGLLGFLATFFLPLLSIIMIISCMASYKNIDGDMVPATDGKILSWLRLNTINMPITKMICNLLIKKNFKTWDKVFAIYFKDADHDINVLARKLYE